MSNRKWWQQNSYRYSNTIKQHRDRIKRNIRYYDEDEEEVYYNTDYDWDRKLTESSKNNKEDSYFENYKKTGVWRGYNVYKPQTLSYLYVQQMANAIAASNDVKTRVGSEWRIDLEKRELVYNPSTMVYGTKSDLLAVLLHEVGKSRHIVHPSLLEGHYIKKYYATSSEILLKFEDIRVDIKMIKEYESAAEIFDSAISQVEDMANRLYKRGESVKYNLIKDLEGSISEINSSIEREKQSTSSNKFITEYYGSDVSSQEDLMQRNIALIREINNNGTYLHFCAELSLLMYGCSNFGEISKQYRNIEKAIEISKPIVEKIKVLNSSQDVLNILENELFPNIVDMLSISSTDNETIKKHFPDIRNDLLSSIIYYTFYEDRDEYPEARVGQLNTRSSGQSDSTIPPEWTSGDYENLKDSINVEAKQLIRRLTFLKREEEVNKYAGNQRRGKLDSKKLYKASVGNTRLFKKIMPKVDTVRSFAFSIVLDISGSMNGPRIAHSTRATIMLAEVFNKMQIPFEIIVFNDGAKLIKGFDTLLDKRIKSKIGGLINAANNGSNLNRGLDMVNIKKRTELNKVVIVLTDGGVGSPVRYDNEYFIPWSKMNIKSFGIGLECEDEIRKLCMGNSIKIDNTSEIPTEFSSIVKRLISKKNV